MHEQRVIDALGEPVEILNRGVSYPVIMPIPPVELGETVTIRDLGGNILTGEVTGIESYAKIGGEDPGQLVGLLARWDPPKTNEIVEAIVAGQIGGHESCVVTSGIAGCGPHTRVSAGRWSVIPPTLQCFIELEIGAFTSIAAGLKIVSGQHPPVEHPKCLSTFPFAERWGIDYPPSKLDGIVRIGNDVWIGEDVHIIEGVTVGDGAIVGASAVIARDVPPYAVVVGSPGGIKRHRFPAEVVRMLLELQWWNWTDEEIRSRIHILRGDLDAVRQFVTAAPPALR